MNNMDIEGYIIDNKVKRDYLSELYKQRSVIDKIVEPILKKLEEERTIKGINQEENLRLIKMTNQLYYQIPNIVNESLKQDSTICKVLICYLNTNYRIKIYKLYKNDE